MPVSSPTYWTVDDVHAIPEDGNRYELVYGELLVSPVPRVHHQRVVMRLARILRNYCERESVGEVFEVGADLTWERQDVLMNPDVLVVGSEHAGFQRWFDVRRVPLVSEVLSPSTKHHDRFNKRRVYQDRRVDLYWILDADDAFAEVWTPDVQFPAIERERLTWHPQGASAPLTIDLRTLCAR